MKRLLPLLLLFVSFSASAQEGTIRYDRVVKIDIDLPPEMESMRDQIPTENKTAMLLHFNEFESVMQAAPKEESDDREVRGNGFMFRMGGQQGENITYVNHDEGLITEKRDFMGRTFLIEDAQPLLAWKLTGEQSEYIGYAVQKATAVRDSSTIEAWFSPQIPVAIGPERFSGLPGAILVLSVNEGQLSFSATEISLESVAEGAILAPKEGRKVTQEQFDEIMEEKRKEMEAQFGRRGNGARVIMRRN
ncbi:MAG: GLPGLI family protein [Bacteroidetes bacterium]|nr:GLPGLI family protein [Bacteroidota bacterium]